MTYPTAQRSELHDAGERLTRNDHTEPGAADAGGRAKEEKPPTEVLQFIEALGADALNMRSGTTPLWVFDWQDFGGWLNSINGEWLFELTLAQDEDAEELRAWVNAQPETVRELVEVVTDVSADLIFSGVVDADMDPSTLRRIGEVLAALTEAWEERDVLQGPQRHQQPHHSSQDVDQISAVNAWVVMGSDESFPTPDELADQQSNARQGMYNWTWTVNKATRAGDLLLFYFIAPRKSLQFVARAVTDAFFERATDPSTKAAFGPAQWWAHVSPLVPIPSIDVKTLQELLEQPVMRGRSGRYCKPTGIERLRGHLKLTASSLDTTRLLPTPTGAPELPSTDDMTLREWRNIADGALYPEKVVEQFVVEPLIRLALGKRPADCEIVGQYRIGQRSADHVILRDAMPTCVIETKVTVRRPTGSDWTDSPDFRQVVTYARALSVPAILVDAHSVYVLSSDLQRIEREFERRWATAHDLAAVEEIVLGTSQPSSRPYESRSST